MLLKRKLGINAENLACDYLHNKGLRLLQKNYHCLFGEIDLIMQQDDVIVFVEVRSQSKHTLGFAYETIDEYKQKKLIKTATFYMQYRNWLYDVPCRFDIIAIQHTNTQPKIEWIKNAFLVEDDFDE